MGKFILFISELFRQRNSGPDSLGTDGSKDESGIKNLNHVLIRLFDDSKGKDSVQLLDMGACKEDAAEALFNNTDYNLRENKADWENCVAVGLDNIAVNVGKKEFHYDTGIGEEQKYIYKWLSLPHYPQHCKQSSGTIFRSARF